MEEISLLGKKVLIKYPKKEDTQSDESGFLIGENEESYFLKDEQGRLIRAPKNKNHAKIVSLEEEDD